MTNVLIKPQLYRKWFVDEVTGKFRPAGSLIRPQQLCETLAVIAKEGGDALHGGSLTSTFVADIQALGGIITEKDMQNYRFDTLILEAATIGLGH